MASEKSSGRLKIPIRSPIRAIGSFQKNSGKSRYIVFAATVIPFRVMYFTRSMISRPFQNGGALQKILFFIFPTDFLLAAKRHVAIHIGGFKTRKKRNGLMKRKGCTIRAMILTSALDVLSRSGKPVGLGCKIPTQD